MKLTQTEVAERLNVQRQAISRWENGKTMPLSAEWYQIGQIYGVSLDYLVYGVRTMPVSRHGVLGEVFREKGPPVGPKADLKASCLP